MRDRDTKGRIVEAAFGLFAERGYSCRLRARHRGGGGRQGRVALQPLPGQAGHLRRGSGRAAGARARGVRGAGRHGRAGRTPRRVRRGRWSRRRSGGCSRGSGTSSRTGTWCAPVAPVAGREPLRRRAGRGGVPLRVRGAAPGHPAHGVRAPDGRRAVRDRRRGGAGARVLRAGVPALALGRPLGGCGDRSCAATWGGSSPHRRSGRPRAPQRKGVRDEGRGGVRICRRVSRGAMRNGSRRSWAARRCRWSGRTGSTRAPTMRSCSAAGSMRAGSWGRSGSRAPAPRIRAPRSSRSRWARRRPSGLTWWTRRWRGSSPRRSSTAWSGSTCAAGSPTRRLSLPNKLAMKMFFKNAGEAGGHRPARRRDALGDARRLRRHRPRRHRAGGCPGARAGGREGRGASLTDGPGRPPPAGFPARAPAKRAGSLASLDGSKPGGGGWHRRERRAA